MNYTQTFLHCGSLIESTTIIHNISGKCLHSFPLHCQTNTLNFPFYALFSIQCIVLLCLGYLLCICHINYDIKEAIQFYQIQTAHLQSSHPIMITYMTFYPSRFLASEFQMKIENKSPEFKSKINQILKVTIWIYG